MLTHATTVLRAWTEADLPALGILRNDLALQSLLMTQPRPNAPARVREWLQARSTQEDGIFFVVADTNTDNAVGFIQVQNIKLLHGTGDFGICLAPTSQGAGHGKAALTLLETYLRNTFNLRKLVLHVLADNANALRFYDHAGFVVAGRLTRHFYLNGNYQDVVIMEKMFVS